MIGGRKRDMRDMQCHGINDVIFYHVTFRTRLCEVDCSSPPLKMERSMFLACLWLTLIGIIQGDTIGKSRVRHLFVQRRSPIPGSPKKLFELAHEVENKLQSSSDQNVHKLLSRVRRSLNPDMKPSVNEVRVVC